MIATTLSKALRPLRDVFIPGRRPGEDAHINSKHRMVLTGVLDANGNRVKLRAWRVSGVWQTSEFEVQRFLDALRSDGAETELSAADADEVEQQLIAKGF